MKVYFKIQRCGIPTSVYFTPNIHISIEGEKVYSKDLYTLDENLKFTTFDTIDGDLPRNIWYTIRFENGCSSNINFFLNEYDAHQYALDSGDKSLNVYSAKVVNKRVRSFSFGGGRKRSTRKKSLRRHKRR
jgi:hypothetical protein